mmetsp:Transcript_5503/g.17662  ORF Transcript_5503/g.17662 Transcript_5503/m.17662 type:complete len:127 (-) Transcript_5503:66-446(-)
METLSFATNERLMGLSQSWEQSGAFGTAGTACKMLLEEQMQHIVDNVEIKELLTLIDDLECSNRQLEEAVANVNKEYQEQFQRKKHLENESKIKERIRSSQISILALRNVELQAELHRQQQNTRNP